MLAGYGHLLAAGTRMQWDADAIDLRGDAAAFDALEPSGRRRVTALLAGFWVAEHSVAEQLGPYLASSDGDARRCFALQAHDERRHAHFFDRVMREVLGLDPRAVAGAEIVGLFERELPATAARLAAGTAQLTDAVGLYHLILEAIVLAVGEEALLAEAATLPAVAAGAACVQADERWHIGLGVQVLSEAGGVAPELAALADRAARSWGPELATPARVEVALSTHRRRLRLLSPPPAHQ